MKICPFRLVKKFECFFFCLECLGHFCCDDIFAKEPFPAFRASIKDGYAVRLFSDENREQIYEIVGRSDAGGDDVTKRERIF